MQSWLNWYSIGLENRHSERISGFESLALRYALMEELADAADLSSVACKGVRDQVSLSARYAYVVKRLRQWTATP